MATIATRSLGFSIHSRYDGDGVRRARRDIDDFTRSVNRSSSALNSSSGRFMLYTKAALLFGPALVPIAANLTAIAGASVAMGAALAVGLGVYAAAANDAIATTLALEGSGKKLTSTQKVFLSNFHAMGAAWTKFTQATQTTTLIAANNVIAGITKLIPLMKQQFDAVAPSIQKVTQLFQNWASSDRPKQYSAILAEMSKAILPNLISAGRDLINVLGDGFRAFVPRAVDLSKAIKDGARSLREWSDGGGFQRFLNYVKETSPEVKEFFSALKDALKSLAKAFAEAAPFSLLLSTNILRLVAALPPEWIDAIVKGFVAWKLAMAGLMVIQTVIKLVTALRIAWFALSLAFTASTLGLVILAIAALVAGIILLIKNWDTVSGALKTAWNATWNAMKMAVEAVWNALKIAWNAVVNAFQTAWNAVSSALTTAWNAVWNALKTAAEAVWNALKIAWNAVVNAFQTAWNAVSSALTTAWNAVWNALTTAAQAVWNALQAAWNAVCNAFSTVWSAISGALQAAWSAVWNAIQTAAQAVWSAIQAAWNAVCNAFQTVWSAISGALQSAWSAFWNALQTAAQAIWTALQAAWNAFLTAVQTVWNTISAVIRTAWQAFWNALQTAAQAIWTALQAAWNAFLNAIQTIWNTVSSAVRAAWDTFWNAIQTFVQGIWTALQQAWDTFLNAIQTAWDTASETLMNAIETVWNTIKDTASDIWDGIKGVIGDAVNGIIDIINGIIGAWNTITDAVGLDSLNIGEIGHVNFSAGGVVTFANGGMVGGEPTHFARGGVIPGYAPGKDTVHAMLSKGEGVLVPEAVRGLGPDFVHAANYYFSHGRGGQNVSFPGYAAGGIAAFGRDPQGHMGWGTSFFQGGGVIGPTPGPGIGGSPTGPGLGTVGQDGMQGVGQEAADDGDDGGGFGGFIRDAAGGVAGVLTGGLIGDGGGVANMVLGFIGREAIEAAFDAVMGMLDNFGMAGNFGKLLVEGTRKIVEMMIEDLVRRDEAAKQEFEAMAVAGAQSVSAWGPLAAQALALAGLSPSQLPAFLALMAAESGGNPNAINNWDINAANGVPSQGLMQVIPPTFAAYHVAGTSNNILDPLANMAAAANYIRNRYGGVVPGSPYADGTDNATPGMHLVGEEGPELVTSPGYAMFGGGEQVLNAADTAAALGGGGGAAAAGMSASGFTGGAGGSVETPDDVFQLIQQLIESAQQLQALLPAMWSQIVSATDSSWKTMSSGTFAPLNANLAGTIPTSMTAMKTAWMAGMTEVGTATTTQWAAMDSTAFTPMNAMMTTTVPASAASMNTAVTGSTQQMQGSVQASWGQMETGTEQSWTNIEGSITDSVTAATTPINGLLTGFNNVSSSLGMGVTVPLIAFADGGLVPAFAGGGMLHKKGGALPGYAPGKDRIPAMLSPGEGVLTPEAVRGLGGPSFVYAANKKFSGHRGAGKGGPSMGHFATGGMAMSTQKRLLPGGVPDPHSGRQLFFSGTITPQVAAGLAEAGIPTSMVSQGSFSTGVAASAGTHDGDGVVDISSTSVEAQMRNVGWAAWTRGNGDGMSPHTHGVLMSASGMSPAAMWQVLDFINGGSGLGVGSASAGELAGWGLGLGRWDFGPLIKDLVNSVKTNVPPMLRPIVLKKLSRDQVASGFAEKKAALDAMSVGTGPWADGLRGMGTRSHDGAVDFIASRATSFDRGGWWQPGTFGYNGTGKPELAVPADDLEVIANSIKATVGHNGDCPHIEVNFNGPVNNAEEVHRAVNDELIPKLRGLMQQGVGHHN